MTIVPSLPGSEPFFFPGDKTGCLILHGFMTSPAEVRWLGEHLAGQGLTVLGPRLPGHGADPRDMARMRWQDWYAAGRDGVHVLRGAGCDKLIFVGHSMGGLLALLLSLEFAPAGVAALASPIGFERPMVRNARWVRYVLPYTDQPDTTELPERVRQEQARRGERVTGRVRYDRWSSAAVAQLVEVARITRERLELISAPLLLIYSPQDQTVAMEQGKIIARRVSSAVEWVELERSGHIITQDVEREQVFARVAAFVKRVRST